MFYLIYLMPIPYPCHWTTAAPLNDFDATEYKVSDNDKPWLYREPYHYTKAYPPCPVRLAGGHGGAIQVSCDEYVLPSGRFELYGCYRSQETGEWKWRRSTKISTGIAFDATGILLATAETEKDAFTAIRRFLYINKIHLPYTAVNVLNYPHDGIIEKIKSVELYDDNYPELLSIIRNGFRFAVQFYIHEGDKPPHYEVPPHATEVDKFVKAWFGWHEANTMQIKYEANSADKITGNTERGEG